MELATLIAVVLVVLAVGSVLLGATLGIPGTVRERPKSRLAPATSGGTYQAAPIPRPVVSPGGLMRRALPAPPPVSPMAIAGAATIGIVIIALGAYFVWLPAQQSFAADRQLSDNVQQGAMLFNQDCARCHGPQGAGSVGPDLHVYGAGQIIDLNGIAARNKVNPANTSDMARLRDMVVATISQGRQGTLMPAWSQDAGGPLNASQISALADLIVVNGWDTAVSAPAPAQAAPAAAAEGDAVALMQKYECGSCHTISGVQGAAGLVGPNLNAEATVPNIPASSGNLPNTPENMQKWIFDAHAIKPGTVMPNFSARGMTEDEAKVIANYVETLKPSIPTPAPVAAAAPAAPAAGGAAPAASGADAQALITKYGCGGCHTISTVPGAVGTIGPNLSKEAAEPKIPRSTGNLDNTPENLQKWIFNAPAVKAGIAMPNFSSVGMTEADAKTIADYLETLK
jgi:mono/diheme cytochrome c family protein